MIFVYVYLTVGLLFYAWGAGITFNLLGWRAIGDIPSSKVFQMVFLWPWAFYDLYNYLKDD